MHTRPTRPVGSNDAVRSAACQDVRSLAAGELRPATRPRSSNNQRAACLIARGDWSVRRDDTLVPHSPTTTTTTKSSPSLPAFLPRRARAKTARRRAQCRANQARYRDKQIAREQALDVSVAQLRQHIRLLHAQRQSLQTRIDTCSVASQTLMTLFHFLRRGLTVVDCDRKRRAPSRVQQLAFITTSVDECVQMGDAHSRKLFVNQLDLFSAWWVRTILSSISNRDVQDRDSTTLHVTSRLELTVTPMTIHNVFPHLLLASNHDVLLKILGKRLMCDVMAVTVFNDIDEIARVDWTIDFFGAMAAFLSIGDVGTVLHGARITQDAFLFSPPRHETEPRQPERRCEQRHLCGRPFAPLDLHDKD